MRRPSLRQLIWLGVLAAILVAIGVSVSAKREQTEAGMKEVRLARSPVTCIADEKELIELACTQLADIGKAIERFHSTCGRYPSWEEGLESLVERPPNCDGWDGPYLEDLPRDPWGRSYHYNARLKYTPCAVASGGPVEGAGFAIEWTPGDAEWKWKGVRIRGPYGWLVELDGSSQQGPKVIIHEAAMADPSRTQSP